MTPCTLRQAVLSRCGRCGRSAMLTYTGPDTPAECEPCYRAWHAGASAPTRRGWPVKNQSECRHGVAATTTRTDGSGMQVRRRVCQRCGLVSRTTAVDKAG